MVEMDRLPAEIDRKIPPFIAGVRVRLGSSEVEELFLPLRRPVGKPPHLRVLH